MPSSGSWIVRRSRWRTMALRWFGIAIATCFFLTLVISNVDWTLDFVTDDGSGAHDDQSGFSIPSPNETDNFTKISSQVLSVFPDPNNVYDDRIVQQLLLDTGNTTSKKVIGVQLMGTDVLEGQGQFMKDGCQVNACEVWRLSKHPNARARAHALLFDKPPSRDIPYNPEQIWIAFLLESPMSTVPKTNIVNWTATYRPDSVLVTPYEKFVTYDSHLPESLRNRNQRAGLEPAEINFALGKQKKVAWFVSNCKSRNDRLEYAKELRKYIAVDIYGGCGNLTCRKRDGNCLSMLSRDYKFYLAFENSNCRHYITEKFYQNALMHDVVPVVMGARKEDYTAVAPPNSFIHVDDYKSPADLAEYLHYLDRNDTAYNEYFHWKGTGEFIDTKFWCRLCAMLHLPDLPRYSYRKVATWWKSRGVCTLGRWYRQNKKRDSWFS